MTDQHEEFSSKYDQAREAFNDLDLEGRVAFLVKESVNTFVHAFETFAETVSRDCASVFGAEAAKDDSADPAADSGSS